MKLSDIMEVYKTLLDHYENPKIVFPIKFTLQEDYDLELLKLLLKQSEGVIPLDLTSEEGFYKSLDRRKARCTLLNMHKRYTFVHYCEYCGEILTELPLTALDTKRLQQEDDAKGVFRDKRLIRGISPYHCYEIAGSHIKLLEPSAIKLVRDTLGNSALFANLHSVVFFSDALWTYRDTPYVRSFISSSFYSNTGVNFNPRLEELKSLLEKVSS